MSVSVTLATFMYLTVAATISILFTLTAQHIVIRLIHFTGYTALFNPLYNHSLSFPPLELLSKVLMHLMVHYMSWVREYKCVGWCPFLSNIVFLKLFSVKKLFSQVF